MEELSFSEVAQNYFELRSCRAVAELYGCSGETIRRILMQNGVKLTGWKQTPEHRLPEKKYERKPKDKMAYERQCEYCGSFFIAHRKNNVFCSKKCKDIAYKISKGVKCNTSTEPFKKVCRVCGTEFETFRATDVMCSDKCRRKWHNRYIRKDGKTREEYEEERKRAAEQRKTNRQFEKILYKQQHTVVRECVICGNTFECLDSETRKTCSEPCSKRLKNRRREKRIPHSQKVDKINLAVLFNRDGGKCYLCGGDCDWNSWRVSKNGTKYPGDSYPTVDHLVPVSKGGLDSWENVRLAHWSCNLQKSDGVIAVTPAGKPEVRGQYSGTSKRTAQYTLDGSLVRVWDSTAQIKREAGLNDSHIQSACRGECKTAFGYRWEYVS